MQIRKRGNTIFLIRTVYDPAVKRGRSVPLGTVLTTSRNAPAELLEKLTDAERQQLEKLLADQRDVLDIAARERAVRRLPYYIRLARDYYLTASKKSPELAALARDSRDAWTSLLAAMVEAGVGRTRNPRTKKQS
jgi:hypothetical protein